MRAHSAQAGETRDLIDQAPVDQPRYEQQVDRREHSSALEAANVEADEAGPAHKASARHSRASAKSRGPGFRARPSEPARGTPACHRCPTLGSMAAMHVVAVCAVRRDGRPSPDAAQATAKTPTTNTHLKRSIRRPPQVRSGSPVEGRAQRSYVLSTRARPKLEKTGTTGGSRGIRTRHLISGSGAQATPGRLRRGGQPGVRILASRARPLAEASGQRGGQLVAGVDVELALAARLVR